MVPTSLKPIIEEIRNFLSYDSETGIFRWKSAPRPGIMVGSVAGCPQSAGYWRISVNGTRYLAHRLAWIHFYGRIAEGWIDHIDGNSMNNAISNLRIATPSENIWNAKKFKSNSSGIKGVSWNKPRGKWLARVYAHRKCVAAKYFDNTIEAEAFVTEQRQIIHKNFSRNQ